MCSTDDAPIDWRTELPVLEGRRVVLRELREADAPALFVLLSDEAVSRFISPPPPSVDGFAKYIAWAQRQRVAGQYICFVVVPRGADAPIGLIHIRSLGPAFSIADWGFALATEYWGTGTFREAAELVVDFTFNVLKTHRLEARAALCNARGNGAMKKLGAQQDGTLRQSFFRNGEYVDQVIWSLFREDWKRRRREDIRVSGVVH
jgi:RimJ/RimL family protein N-acetyltransferase